MKHRKNFTRISAFTILAVCTAPWQHVAAAQSPGTIAPPSSVTDTAAQWSNAANQVAGGVTTPNNALSQATGGAATASDALSQLALVSTLAQQLGVTQQQALGGAGSIFSVARQQMSPSDFSQLSQAVPGISQYLAAAAPLLSASDTTSLLGSAAGLLGGQGSTVVGLASLAGSFQKLGLSPDLIQQFIPVILQYVQSQGGSTTSSLLQKALL
jgi:hypothetical protein